MKYGYKMLLAIGLGATLVQTSALSEDTTAFKDQKEKASYSVGLFFGNQIKGRTTGMPLDIDAVANGIKEVLSGKEPRLTEQQARETIQAYQQESMKGVAEKNHKAGDAFLAENKTKDGIKTLPVTLPDGASAELQYKVLTEGTGATPKDTDTVSVNYRGTLIDGKEFDSSYKRGQPAKFPVTGVIKGWTKALEMMKVGAKWQLFIPASLAYADNARPGIEPGSTLLFDVELLSIDTPPAPATPPPSTTAQPLTSDIIKVPSAEELKKGAKVEVLKAEDVERMLKANAATNAPAPKETK
jgi:FKBP-type peptidyl-prolyl cis-trans isomerase FklB